MSTPHHTRTRVIGLAIATAGFAAAVTGCGSGDTDPGPAAGGSTLTQVAVQGAVTPGPTTSSAGDTPSTTTRCAQLPAPFTQVDACNAIAVTTAALTTMYSTNPTSDRSSQDAILRAVPLLSEQLVSRISAPTAGGQGNVEWQNLKAAHQKVIAKVSVHRQDQSSYYTIDRTALPVSGAGPRATLPSITASPTLIQVADGGFRVDNINPLA